MEILIGPAQEIINKCICDPTFRRLDNAKDMKRNIENLKVVRDRLKAVIGEVKHKVDEAKEMPPQQALLVPESVLEWLRYVQNLEGKVDNVFRAVESAMNPSNARRSAIKKWWIRFKNGSKVVNYRALVKEYLDDSELSTKATMNKLLQTPQGMESIHIVMKKVMQVEEDINEKLNSVKYMLIMPHDGVLQKWQAEIEVRQKAVLKIEQDHTSMVGSSNISSHWLSVFDLRLCEQLELATGLVSQGVALVKEVDQFIRYVNDTETEMADLKIAYSKVLAREETVRAKVKSFKLPTKQVEVWLEKIKKIKMEVGDLEVEYKNLAKSLSNQSILCDLGKKIVEKKSEVDNLNRESITLDEVTDQSSGVRVTKIPITTVIGQQKALDKLRNAVKKEGVSIIAIHGQGGVGKTTLMCKIYNEINATGDFDIAMLVSVSQEANITKIQNEIMNRLGLGKSDDKFGNMEKIFNVLSCKKFVILFDDVWKFLDLKKIGVPTITTNVNKPKIIFTSRSEDVVDSMFADSKIKVVCLGPYEAWQLFKENVGEHTLQMHHEIPGLAKEVAKECKGLPLALVVIGRAMRNKGLVERWRNVLRMLKTSSPCIQGAEEELYSCLKLSYDFLETEVMQSCFLHCSLFPENHKILKKELIAYWMGEGFFDECTSVDDAWDKGCEIIETLKLASLIESIKENLIEYISMHDVIRDMALWIVSMNKQKGVFLVCPNQSEVPKAEKWEEAQRINLQGNSSLRKLKTSTTNYYKLSTLLLCVSRLECLEDGCFQLMQNLKVLDLSYTNIRILPSTIQTLKQLCFLNVAGTRLQKLPEELAELDKLKHLVLYSQEWEGNLQIGDVIKRLSQLQILEMLCPALEDIKLEIIDLERLSSLQDFSVRIRTCYNLSALAGSPKLSNCTSRLVIQDCGGMVSIQLPIKFRAMNRLKTLRLVGCESVEEILLGGAGNGDIAMGHQSIILPRLERLNIDFNYKLNVASVKLLPPLCLPNLRLLAINTCIPLPTLACAGLAHTLEELHIYHCHKMNQLLSKGWSGEGNIVFRVLKKIKLLDLPELSMICRDEDNFSFPSLEILEMRDCPKLNCLPLAINHLVLSGQQIVHLSHSC